MKRLVIVLFAFVFVVGVVGFKRYEKESASVIKEIKKPSTAEHTDADNKTEDNDRIYAVWLTYSEIGSLVKGKSEKVYREALEELFVNLTQNKINTVFYQCRAFCDSLYASDAFPASKYIATEGGALSFDPFGIFLKMAEVNNISVHCWVNPYRVSYDKSFENLPQSSPARGLYEEDKSTLIICEGGIFLNPAHSESRRLVFDGIREILEKYKVKGIHFDDYFYPEAEKINDKGLYKEYKSQGGGLTLEEWRRENVNSLVSGVYSLVKSSDENMVFSISPCADIKKCRNVFYCDVEKWCREEGFVDYIIPQLYFGFQNENMPFERVRSEWESLASEGSVRLVCGLAVYKCGAEDVNAGSGKNEWLENVNILSQQYEQINGSQLWQGFSLFSYSYCFGDNVNQISEKEIKKLLYMVE